MKKITKTNVLQAEPLAPFGRVDFGEIKHVKKGSKNAFFLLGVRYSTSGLAISAKRIAIRPLAKTRLGARAKCGPRFIDEEGVLMIKLP